MKWDLIGVISDGIAVLGLGDIGPKAAMPVMEGKALLLQQLVGADIFISVSVANVLTEAMIQSMNQDPIVFALANPNLEITYEHAMEWGVRVIATGRSDYPNQVNNMLAFLGIFKGALAVQATDINDEMKMAAVKAVSELVTAEQIERGMVIPNVFETDVTNDVAQAAIDSKVAQKIPSLI
ncbi:malic enzyme-like NAD(P)-binding protein [Kurthia gibsonii]|uniref:malic enzyme-like NAD(P)-binding protein n=1 Tax=Kurthia gibsonii TaxID=33946 RepID=UPI0011698E51|nr:hypothetical protein KGI01_16960 [Kurthia gibsonii]